MNLIGIAEVIGASALVLGAGVEIGRLEFNYLPKFEEMYAKHLYEECMDRCHRVCLATCKMTDAAKCDCEPLCKKECFHYIEDRE
jgi:hypothetical protein